MATSAASAEAPSVPAALQAQLLSRMVRYDRGFQARAGERASVIVIAKQGDTDSERDAIQIDAALKVVGKLGDTPVDSRVVTIKSSAAITAAIGTADIVYFASGLSPEIVELARLLRGRSVLTVGAVARDTENGTIFGFELVSARPKILVNNEQAKAQSIELNAELLKLARVVK